MENRFEMRVKKPLYRKIAEEIQSHIISGVYAPYEKLPSIREFAAAKGVSIITILKSYQYLEEQHLIYAMPKSGYYVTSHSQIQFSGERTVTPTEVHVSETVEKISAVVKSEGITDFGVCMPSAELAYSALYRAMGRRMRESTPCLKCSDYINGYDPFREQIIRALSKKSVDIQPEHLLVTGCCTEALYYCLSELCQKGDRIMIQSPCSYNVLNIAEELGLSVIEIPAADETGIDLSFFDAVLESNPIKAVYLAPSINNPLGTTLPDEVKQHIAAKAEEKQVFVIEDDAMGDLYFGQKPPYPIKSFDCGGYVIYCSSFAKSLSPAFSVGWLCNERLIERLQRREKIAHSGNDLLRQSVLAEMLARGSYARTLAKARVTYYERVQQMRRAVLSCFPEGTSVSSPDGGYLLWVTMPEGFPAEQYCHILVKRGVLALPGTLFSPGGQYSSSFRLNAADYSDALLPKIQLMGDTAGELL